MLTHSSNVYQQSFIDKKKKNCITTNSGIQNTSKKKRDQWNKNIQNQKAELNTDQDRKQKKPAKLVEQGPYNHKQPIKVSKSRSE